jgi:hypothetical protein
MDLWKSIRHKFRAAGQLSFRDWLILMEAWWVVLGFHLALRRVSLEGLEAFTRPVPGKMTDLTDTLAWAWHRERLIRSAARLHLLPMTCLPRALTLRWMLGRRGIPAQLRIGIQKNSTGMYAHAWVEMEGESVGEPEDVAERFKPLSGTS